MSAPDHGRRLRPLIGKRVAVDFDDGRRLGVLERVTPNGTFVLLDGDERPTRCQSRLVGHIEGGTCTFCGAAVDPGTGYREVRGFERLRRGGAGGTNAIRLREPTETLACMHCVDAQARGVNAGQGTLG